MKLEDLPDDILLHFLRSLRSSNSSSSWGSDLQTDFKTLSTLNLTSSRIYQLSNPILFSEIPLTIARLGWFLQLLENRPDLRVHARRVITGMNGNIKGKFSSVQAIESCRTALEKVGVNKKQIPIDSDPTSLYHLTRCKILSYLMIPIALKHYESGESEQRFSFAFNSLTFRSNFDCLVELELRSPRQGSYDYSEILRAFQLPNLKKLDVRFIVPDEILDDFFENSIDKIGISNVIDLTLHGALDPSDTKLLSILLSIPKKLKKLNLSSSRNAFSAKAILEGLSHSRESLTDLTLLEARPIGWGIRFEKDPEPLVDLDLPNLESLCISQNYFFGQGGNQEDLNLPESIRILDIVYSISETSLSSLKSFVQNSNLPKSLETIRVDKAFFNPTQEDSDDDDDDSESEYSQDENGNQIKKVHKREIEILREICEKKGLRLGVSKIEAGI